MIVTVAVRGPADGGPRSFTRRGHLPKFLGRLKTVPIVFRTMTARAGRPHGGRRVVRRVVRLKQAPLVPAIGGDNRKGVAKCSRST
jgi:hypothetical protein